MCTPQKPPSHRRLESVGQEAQIGDIIPKRKLALFGPSSHAPAGSGSYISQALQGFSDCPCEAPPGLIDIGRATPGPAGARAPAGSAVPRLEKYLYLNIMSRLKECAPSRDHRAPAVPRLVTKAGCK